MNAQASIQINTVSGSRSQTCWEWTRYLFELPKLKLTLKTAETTADVW